MKTEHAPIPSKGGTAVGVMAARTTVAAPVAQKGRVVMLARSAHVDTFCRDNLPPQSEWPQLDLGHPDVQYPERLNVAAALLDETAARFGADRTCLLTDRERWSYGDLLERASQVAHVLTEDLGLVPGQRVLLRGPNNPWLFACWFGALKAGGVVVATMPLLRTSELTTLTGLTRPAVLLCDQRFAADLAAAAPITPLLTFGGPDDNPVSYTHLTLPTILLV